ncbi:MAG: SH3 domain-containing protein [Oligoflexia bacterium]|nr:SH3 domain-containing protein [Oligoflexia bacterium]
MARLWYILGSMLGMLKKGLFLIIILMAYATLTQAADLRITADEVKVFSSPNPSSDIVTTLFRGDIVKVSNKPQPGGYQKVKVSTSGGDIIGYVRNSDLNPKLRQQTKQQQKQQVRSVVRRGPRGLSTKWSVFLYGGMNYQLQGARSYTNPNDLVTYDITSLAGLSTQFGLGLQFPIQGKFAARAFFELKSIAVNGSATTSSAVPTDIYLKEQFLTFGAGAQYYFTPYWWLGGGLQVDKTSSGTLKAGGEPEVTLLSNDLVMFFAAYLNTGYEFELFKNFYLVPNFKAVMLFSRPLIFEFDGTLNFAYAF